MQTDMAIYLVDGYMRQCAKYFRLPQKLRRTGLLRR